MGFHKNYLNDLICACASENGFAQEAIEYAVVSGWVTLSGNFQHEVDIPIVMAQYDTILDGYHKVIRDREALVT